MTTPARLQHGRRLTPAQRAACAQFHHERLAGTTTITLTDFAKHLRCSRDTLYRWLTRTDILGKNPGPAPGRVRRPLPEPVAHKAQALRDAQLGVPDITAGLQLDFPNLGVTEHQVRTHGRQQDWPRLRPPPTTRITRPFTNAPPGFLHMDLIIGPDSGRGTVLLTIKERHSRWGDALAIPSKASSDVVVGLQTLLARCPVRITTVLTDCGSEFRADLDRFLRARGIDHRRTEPYTPQTNGMVERWNAQIKHHGPLSDPRWWVYQPGEKLTVKDIWEQKTTGQRHDRRIPRMNEALWRWSAWRNLIRPNQQLGRTTTLAWCMAHPAHCDPVILQRILQAWVAQPTMLVTDSRCYYHAPPDDWLPPSV